MEINFNEPVKCKDCNIWWRGETHRCDPVTPVLPSNPQENLKPHVCKYCSAKFKTESEARVHRASCPKSPWISAYSDKFNSPTDKKSPHDK